MLTFLKNRLGVILSVVLGGGVGYLYYKFIGCANGTCKITSSPIISTLYGGLMGGLFFDLLQGFIRKFKSKK